MHSVEILSDVCEPRPVDVAVLIPCYNEEKSIGEEVSNFRAVLPDAEIYVYDNNSQDNTALIAEAAGAIVRHERMQGKGHVVRRMFADIEADVYVLVDGDGTYDPNDAPRLVQYLLEHHLDLVNGLRNGLHERKGHRLGNEIFNRMVGWTFGDHFCDMLSGYKVFSRRFVKSFPVLATGFEIETELTVHALHLRMPVAELSTSYGSRCAGSASKLRTVRDGIRILWTIFKMIKQDRPLAFFGVACAVLVALSVFLALPLVITYFETGSATAAQRVPTAVLATGMMVLGFMSLACGLILDTVTRGRIEMKRMHYLDLRAPDRHRGVRPVLASAALCEKPQPASTAPVEDRGLKRFLMMRFMIAIVVLFAIAQQAYAIEPNTAFVKVSGTSFAVDGKPFLVTGVNNHYLPFGTDTEVTAVLDDAVALGANVVRTFLVPVIGSPDDDRTTIWKWRNISADTSDLNVHGNYLLYWNYQKNEMGINEGPNGIQKVDNLIAEAKKRHLRLIFALLDFWDFTGGIQQMVAWYNKNYLSWPQLRALPFARDDHFFFTDPRTIRDYQHWVEYVINRMNPQTGLRYRDDPTIMAWDVANEANAKPDDLRLQWTQVMAAFIKKFDHNHLVASGNANVDVSRFDIELPEIDFGTWHGYPKYLRIGVDEFDRLIRQYCEVAAKYQKPVLLEEFGWARSNPNQAAAYAKWLNRIAQDPNCAGWVVWRLVAHEQNGRYPVDDHPLAQFDVRRDETELWNVIHEAIIRGRGNDADR
jgi:mannan endo-1,4-beta-mannosidase